MLNDTATLLNWCDRSLFCSYLKDSIEYVHIFVLLIVLFVVIFIFTGLYISNLKDFWIDDLRRLTGNVLGRGQIEEEVSEYWNIGPTGLVEIRKLNLSIKDFTRAGKQELLTFTGSAALSFNLENLLSVTSCLLLYPEYAELDVATEIFRQYEKCTDSCLPILFCE